MHRLFNLVCCRSCFKIWWVEVKWWLCRGHRWNSAEVGKLYSKYAYILYQCTYTSCHLAILSPPPPSFMILLFLPSRTHSSFPHFLPLSTYLSLPSSLHTHHCLLDIFSLRLPFSSPSPPLYITFLPLSLPTPSSVTAYLRTPTTVPTWYLLSKHWKPKSWNHLSRISYR